MWLTSGECSQRATYGVSVEVGHARVEVALPLFQKLGCRRPVVGRRRVVERWHLRKKFLVVVTTKRRRRRFMCQLREGSTVESEQQRGGSICTNCQHFYEESRTAMTSHLTPSRCFRGKRTYIQGFVKDSVNV